MGVVDFADPCAGEGPAACVNDRRQRQGMPSSFEAAVNKPCNADFFAFPQRPHPSTPRCVDFL